MDAEKIEDIVYNKLCQVVNRRQSEFGIKTNQIIYDKNLILKNNFCNTPDFLISTKSKIIVGEVTTASDLENPKRQFGTYKEPKFCDFELPDLVSLRIKDKIEKNLKHVNDFEFPIVIFLCGSNRSSFIDENQVRYFVETNPKYAKYVLNNTPKQELISAIIWCKISDDENNIIDAKYFPNFGAKNKIYTNTITCLKNLLLSR